ncbi:MAG: DUF4234 domain-containing protein [Lachnospiraceae bacterium]|nr:DUF4234 domain-containing protein [Lachnospiraceae bacterium]
MVQKRSIPLCIILTIVTCGIYGIYWFIKLTDEVNTLNGQEGTSGVVAFLLTLVTCGIYGLYWAYKQGEKIESFTGEKGNLGIIYLILEVVGLGIVAYALMQDKINKKVEA